MKIIPLTISLVLALLAVTGETAPAISASTPDSAASVYAGSRSCLSCHERFYTLWSTSFHGLAMQPYSDDFARSNLIPQDNDIISGVHSYRAFVGQGEGYVRHTGQGGRSETFRMVFAIGGKNVYYFLTPLDRGRLQTLPVAFDVRKREWFDTARSGVRHLPGQNDTTPVGWQEWHYTFNTSCYGCHLSQLDTNYSRQTNSYATRWKEPGINCETCHGPSSQHNAAMRALPDNSAGKKLSADGSLILTSRFTPSQHNDACGSCHSRSIPLTATYLTPGRFFDNFDLITLENRDFYPDGRDLGENYTYASWLMSPCAKGGSLHCVTCHTSSGRYRFSRHEDANKACLPCHAERVQNVSRHSHHPAGSTASRCISCHMPGTDFARMRRTDHSMRPPAPSATLAHHSPNACNGCHKEKDAVWADRLVRQWHSRDYQAPVLRRAALIAAARKGDWTKSADMMAEITAPKRDEIFATSLIRLFASSDDPSRIPTLRKALADPSPLVRSAAVEALGYNANAKALEEIAAATGDEYRIVRVRAAAALANYPDIPVSETVKLKIDRATDEYLAFIMARPDQWTSHFNMGNYQLGKSRYREAIDSYQQALKLEPRSVMPLVNISIAYARNNERDRAESALRQALEIMPEHPAAHFNMGLVKAERNEPGQAEFHLRKAFSADPGMDRAAYNLCVIISKKQTDEAISWCRKASELKPQNPEYAYTLAYYLAQSGEKAEAKKNLNKLLALYPTYRDAKFLLEMLAE